MAGVRHTHWSQPVLPLFPCLLSSWNHQRLLLTHLFNSPLCLSGHTYNVGLLHDVCLALPPEWVFQSAQGHIFWVHHLVTNGARFFNKLCSCLYATSRSVQSPAVLGKKIWTLAEQLTAGDLLQALIFQKLCISVLHEHTNYCSSQEIKDISFTHRHYVSLVLFLKKKPQLWQRVEQVKKPKEASFLPVTVSFLLRVCSYLIKSIWICKLQQYLYFGTLQHFLSAERQHWRIRNLYSTQLYLRHLCKLQLMFPPLLHWTSLLLSTKLWRTPRFPVWCCLLSPRILCQLPTFLLKHLLSPSLNLPRRFPLKMRWECSVKTRRLSLLSRRDFYSRSLSRKPPCTWGSLAATWASAMALTLCCRQAGATVALKLRL